MRSKAHGKLGRSQAMLSGATLMTSRFEFSGTNLILAGQPFSPNLPRRRVCDNHDAGSRFISLCLCGLKWRSPTGRAFTIHWVNSLTCTCAALKEHEASEARLPVLTEAADD